MSAQPLPFFPLRCPPHGHASQRAKPLVVVVAAGTAGDLIPFLTIASGLASRGHEVMMAAPSFQAKLVQEAGVPFRGFGDPGDGRALLADPELWDPKNGWSVIWDGIAPHLTVVRDILAEMATDRPVVVLTHPLMAPAADIARSQRPSLRVVTAFLAPSNLCSRRDMRALGPLRIPTWLPPVCKEGLWRLVRATILDPLFLPRLNLARRGLGLPAISNFTDHLLNTADVSIGLFPDWFGPIQPDWPGPFIETDFPAARPGTIEQSLAPALEHFLEAGEAPLVFTPGTGHQHAAGYFGAALQAVQRLGRRAVFVSSHTGQVPKTLPATVHGTAFAPFRLLLPRAAALVHHGGVGTTAEAFRAGVPQLIVPYAYDQFDNGLRVKALGCGDVLWAKRASGRRLAIRLNRLLTSSQVRRDCQAVAARCADPLITERIIDIVEAALLDGLTPRLKGA